MYNYEDVSCADPNDDAPVQESISEAGHYCGFCQKEFESLADFRESFHKCGFICNNCLDYFSDMPWFHEAEVEFLYVRPGALFTYTST